MPSVLRELAKHRIDVNEGSKTHEEQAMMFFTRQESSNQERDRKANGFRVHPRDCSPRLAS